MTPHLYEAILSWSFTKSIPSVRYAPSKQVGGQSGTLTVIFTFIIYPFSPSLWV